MLEEEYLPELSLELHSNLSIELKRESKQAEDRLKIVLNEKDKEIQALKAKVDTLEAGSRHSLAMMEKLQTDIKRVEDDYKAAIIQKNLEIADLKNQDVVLETKTNQLETKSKALKETATKLRSDINRVDGVVNQHTGQISTLVTQTNGLETNKHSTFYLEKQRRPPLPHTYSV